MQPRTLARAAGLVAVGAVGARTVFPRMLMRAFAPPQRDASATPGDHGLDFETVFLRSPSGAALHAWFIPADGPAPLVVVLHGWGANASLMLPLAPHLHASGFHALFLDARNHGHSDHERFTSMPRFAEDLEVAVEWACQRSDVTSIGVVGHSVGAGAAIFSASRRDGYGAVVAVAAPAHPGELMRRHLSRVPDPILDGVLGTVERIIEHRFESFAPRYRIGLVTAPLLLVHGDADRVVPIDDLRELADLQPAAEILVVPDGGHSDLAPYEARIDEVLGFLDRTLRSRS